MKRSVISFGTRVSGRILQVTVQTGVIEEGGEIVPVTKRKLFQIDLTEFVDVESFKKYMGDWLEEIE